MSTEKIITIPSEGEKSVIVTIEAEESLEKQVNLNLRYYPSGHEDQSNIQMLSFMVRSQTRGGGGALAIGVVIIIIAIIIFVIWKKRQ